MAHSWQLPQNMKHPSGLTWQLAGSFSAPSGLRPSLKLSLKEAGQERQEGIDIFLHCKLGHLMDMFLSIFGLNVFSAHLTLLLFLFCTHLLHFT